MTHSLMTHTTLRCLTTLAALALPMTIASGVLAATECGDLTCPDNYRCVSGEQEVCGPSTANCLTEPDGKVNCTDVETGVCDTETYHYCEPLPCAGDSVCGSDMKCMTYTSESCSGSAGVSCDEATGECTEEVVSDDCTTTEQSACVPKWYLPCETAASCGEGFTCEQQEQCSCSGSAGSTGSGTDSTAPAASGGASSVGSDPGAGAASSDSADVAMPEQCSCEKTGEFRCVMKTIVCESADACPANWTCEANPQGTCASSSDGTTNCAADPEKICVPPYSDLYGARDSSDALGSTATGGGDISVDNETADDGDGVGTSKGSTAGADEAGGEAAPSDESSSGDSATCSFSGGPSRNAGAPLALFGLGLAALLRLRRRS